MFGLMIATVWGLAKNQWQPEVCPSEMPAPAANLLALQNGRHLSLPLGDIESTHSPRGLSVRGGYFRPDL